MKKLARIFQIKTKAEVFLITYPLALGAVRRGQDYMVQYPGRIGWLFMLLCMGAVFVASAKMLQAVDYHQQFGVD
jgi:hypothetical protein